MSCGFDPAIGTKGSSQDARGLFSALLNSLYRISFICYNRTVNSVFVLLSGVEKRAVPCFITFFSDLDTPYKVFEIVKWLADSRK